MPRQFRYLFLMLYCCIISVAACAQIVYGDNKTSGKYISVNNTQLYYETYGSGKPLVLIHGNGTGIKGWAAQIEYFSKAYTVYAIDCRGRGKSPLGNDTLSYIQQADDIAAFVRQLKLDTVNVIGKSDGGIIAILMGIYYPEHLNKIVAFGANMWPDSSALYPNIVQEVTDMRIKAEQMIALKDRTDDWNLVWQRNHMMETQPHITTAELHRIKTPVLVLSCDRDLIREEHTLFIYQHIPNAHLGILPGESHHVAKQNPLLFNSTIANYFAMPERGEAYRYKQ